MVGMSGISLLVKRGVNEPCGCAYDALPFVLGLDAVEFILDELSDVPNEGQDLLNPIIDQGHRGKEVDNRACYRLCALRGG